VAILDMRFPALPIRFPLQRGMTMDEKNQNQTQIEKSRVVVAWTLEALKSRFSLDD
jgi:hypothetical protein